MSFSAQPTAAERPQAAPAPEAQGILEILPSGSGFLRNGVNGYQAADGDVFVSQSLIRRYGLRTGDRLEGTTGTPPGRGKSAPMDQVFTVNGLDPAHARERVDFQSLPPPPTPTSGSRWSARLRASATGRTTPTASST
jgi:transcription termination factor Rho